MTQFIFKCMMACLFFPATSCADPDTTPDSNESLEAHVTPKATSASEGATQKDRYGRPQLILAVLNKDLEAARTLLANGADANATYQGATALIFATFEGRCYLPMMELLLEAGAAVDAHTPTTKSTSLIEAAAIGDEKCFDLLLRYKANPLTTTEAGENLLHHAVLGGNPAIVSKVLDMPIDINARGLQGVTPLMIAAAAGDDSIVRQLMDAGAEPCHIDSRGRTAKMIARESDKQNVAAMLPNCESIVEVE